MQTINAVNVDVFFSFLGHHCAIKTKKNSLVGTCREKLNLRKSGSDSLFCYMANTTLFNLQTFWEPLDISTNLAPTALYSYEAIYLHGSFCVFSCIFVEFFCCLVLGANVFLNLG
jgi:hypothetical protein